jgi:acyl dehydratase
MSKQYYYEDIEVGQQFRSHKPYTITKDSAIAFAREYDPQAMHIDEVNAKHSQLGELVASGWHTAAATMRLKTETDLFHVSGGLLGLGVENLRWPQPTKPGDTLRLVITITAKRLSKSKPGFGIIHYTAETFNQRDELVLEMKPAIIVPCRNP